MVFAVLLWVGLILLSGFGVLLGIGSLLLGFDRYEEERAIRTTPTASLDSVAVGPTAVQGRVEPVGRTIGALYGCDACVAYDLTVEDTGSDRSQTHVDRCHCVPFDIVGETGTVRVDSTAFDFHVSADRQWEQKRRSAQSAAEPLRRFERNWEIPELRTGDERRYEASYLCPGDEVYAYGTADIDADREQETAKPIELTGRDGLFFLSDQSPDTLLRERRYALAKSGIVGITVAVASLAAFLWLTGIAQVFLGA